MMPALLERPDLPEHLHLAWSAFTDLSSDRQIGFGVIGAIPFTAIDRYADRIGIESGDEFETFKSLIRILDAEWRVLNTKKPDAERR